MRNIFTIVAIVVCTSTQAQTVTTIDSLHKSILKNLTEYNCLEYADKVIYNDDAVGYDTARFYYDDKLTLVYINWINRTHTFHISGDDIDITELIFLNDQVVLKRSYGYSFQNAQWHLEPALNETLVSVVESIREYYREDGSALMEYMSRSTEGVYRDRFSILDDTPLKEKLQRRWSIRCDECIEEDYLSLYQKLLAEKKGE